MSRSCDWGLGRGVTLAGLTGSTWGDVWFQAIASHETRSQHGLNNSVEYVHTIQTIRCRQVENLFKNFKPISPNTPFRMGSKAGEKLRGYVGTLPPNSFPLVQAAGEFWLIRRIWKIVSYSGKVGRVRLTILVATREVVSLFFVLRNFSRIHL